MKHRIGSVSLLVVSVMIFAIGCSPRHQEPVPKVVYVILDGISADIIQQADTPNIDAISRKGGFSEAETGGRKGLYSESPTSSAIGYNHLMTGTWSNKHNVYDNDIEQPNYNYWSLYRLIETVKPELKTAIFSSWTDNRTKLVGEGLPEAGGFNIDIVVDGFDLDTLNFPHDSAYVQKIDERIATEASKSILEEAPDFSWVYLWYTDDTGHAFGYQKEYFSSIQYADSLVGLIMRSVSERESGHNEDWMVVITTDHGRRISEGKGHGGQSDSERSVWFSTNITSVNKYFRDGKLKHVDLYPSIARYLGVQIPETQRYELDGVPFTGPVSVSDLRAYRDESGTIDLKWKAWELEGMTEIKVSPTNKYKQGGMDEYSIIDQVPVADEYFRIDLTIYDLQSADTLKIIVEGTHNSAGVWSIDPIK